MLDGFFRQLRIVLVRRRAEATTCKYFVMVRTSRGAVTPAAYCITLDEARQTLNRIVEERRDDGFMVVVSNNLSAVIVKHLPSIDVIVCLQIGIEQAPPLTRLDNGTGGFSSN